MENLRNNHNLKDYIIDFCRHNRITTNRLLFDADISTGNLKTFKENKISLKQYFSLCDSMAKHSVFPVEFFLFKLKNIVQIPKY